MEQLNFILVDINGGKGAQTLVVDNYDIKELENFLHTIDSLISNGGKRAEVSLKEIKEGSVKLKFLTTIQATAMFAATLSVISGNEPLKGVEPATAKAVEDLQKEARQKGYCYTFSTANSENKLEITPLTKFKRNDSVWVDGEFYFYGIINDAGGKTNPNIHLETKEFGSLTIDASKEYLRDQPENLLYHTCGVRAKGRQNLETKEIDKDSLELISIIDYSPKFDEEYLNGLIDKATPILSAIPDKQAWIDELRGRQ